jgi:hypothetical protein
VFTVSDSSGMDGPSVVSAKSKTKKNQSAITLNTCRAGAQRAAPLNESCPSRRILQRSDEKQPARCRRYQGVPWAYTSVANNFRKKAR